MIKPLISRAFIRGRLLNGAYLRDCHGNPVHKQGNILCLSASSFIAAATTSPPSPTLRRKQRPGTLRVGVERGRLEVIFHWVPSFHLVHPVRERKRKGGEGEGKIESGGWGKRMGEGSKEDERDERSELNKLSKVGIWTRVHNTNREGGSL